VEGDGEREDELEVVDDEEEEEEGIRFPGLSPFTTYRIW
jgi:hypothetical protein